MFLQILFKRKWNVFEFPTKTMHFNLGNLIKNNCYIDKKCIYLNIRIINKNYIYSYG